MSGRIANTKCCAEKDAHMSQALRQFQVFAKPIGPICNLGCDYCYYLDKHALYPGETSYRMPDDVLEAYIVQHIAACPDPVIRFSWHGGEPCLLGLDYFRNIVALEDKHCPPNRRIVNGIQTNGTLLDEAWCRFFADEGFVVGVSLDGPQALHDLHRVTRDRKPTHEQAVRGYTLLQQHHVASEILCVANADNVRHPLQVYRFFKQLKAQYVTFLPLVEPRPDARGGVSRRSVPPEAFGTFLCTIFDEWQSQDIGRIKVQIFEEAARTAFGQAHTLCIFRPSCGDVPVVEHNGDFYSCDHFVDERHRLGNIRETRLVDLLESPAQRAFGQAKMDTLPRTCQVCEVVEMCNGGCPKNRFLQAPNGQGRLNYLCAGYEQFFSHCQPFVRAIAALWRQQSREQPAPSARGVGRNDPCPCGSGKKYKKCCMGKAYAG
jgi:uncharacterized protein